MNTDKIKRLLDEKAAFYNSPQFIISDPISVPHLFTKKQDIEIAGFFSATISWGQRKTIIQNAKKLMEWMDFDPHNFILNFSEKEIKPFKTFVHRTFNGEDCEYFLWSLKNIYQRHSDMESAFVAGFSPKERNLKPAIITFRNLFFSWNPLTRTQKHVADPSKNSAAKRLNMFLRWMVRQDDCGVDFGIWSKIQPSQLLCPLDTHSGRVARNLRILQRKTDDWQAAEELTSALAAYDPLDPVKYDFALFGLGIFEHL
ncbi:MAG: TIGR02757 family protein [Candidatus Moranbacteria bacterium]|nr:TIGR02757 family protein [Candidatus Moranbacteria bacterium]